MINFCPLRLSPCSCSSCAALLLHHPSLCPDSSLYPVYPFHPSPPLLVLASTFNFLSSLCDLPRLFSIPGFISSISPLPATCCTPSLTHGHFSSLFLLLTKRDCITFSVWISLMRVTEQVFGWWVDVWKHKTHFKTVINMMRSYGNSCQKSPPTQVEGQSVWHCHYRELDWQRSEWKDILGRLRWDAVSTLASISGNL